MSDCNCHSEVVRDGSSQLSRYLKALDPSYAPVDNRNIEELLVYIKRYAAQIRFYDIPESDLYDSDNTKINWREFFRRDIAVIAASVADYDIVQIKKDYDEERARVESNPASRNFSSLFKPIVGMAAKIDRWYTLAVPENPLHVDLKVGIDSTLRSALTKAREYEAGFTSVDSKNPLKISYESIEDAERWGLDSPVNPDHSIYIGATPGDRVRNAALFVDDLFHRFYSFITELVDRSENYMKFALEQYPSHQPHMALFIAFLKLFRIAQDHMNGLTERMLNYYYRDVLRLVEKPSIPDRVHMVFELAQDVAEHVLQKETSLDAGKDQSNKEQVYRTESELVINQAKVKELKTIFVDKVPVTGSDKMLIKNIFARPVANSADGFGEKFTGPSLKWPTFGLPSPKDLDTIKNPCELIDYASELLTRHDQAQVGFAIASPQLLLQGGNRLIKIRVNEFEELFEGPLAANDKPFEIWLSGEKGWVGVTEMMRVVDRDEFMKYIKVGIFNPLQNFDRPYFFTYEEQIGTSKEYSVFIYLPTSVDAIIAFDPALHPGYRFTNSQPVLRFMINTTFGNRKIISEEKYRKIKSNSLALEVKVGSIISATPDELKIAEIEREAIRDYYFDGLKNLVLQNEQEVVPPDKPFDPFTAYPAKGKSFYIGSQEFSNKKISKLAVDIRKTIDVDNDETDPTKTGTGKVFAMLSKEYNGETLYTYRVSVLEKRNWTRLSTDSKEDFNQPDLAYNILNVPGKENTPKPLVLSRLPLTTNAEWSSQSEKGFIRINNLLPALGSKANFLTLQELQEFAPLLEMKEVSVNYESRLDRLEQGIDQLFHLYPFGVAEVSLTAGRKGKHEKPKPGTDASKDISDTLPVQAAGLLLPQFTWVDPYLKYQQGEPVDDAGEYFAKNPEMGRLLLEVSGIREKIDGAPNQYSGSMQEEGMLFIGLEKVKSLQSLSMLFQFADGSAEDEDRDPPEIHWSYLNNNEWRSLPGENLVSDGTYGFQTTGIIKLDVPRDITANNTIITKDLYWFCASVKENSNRIPQLIDVVAQAVVARFDDQENDQRHFDSVLASETISKLSSPVAEVSQVKQPFASFDGKHREVGKEFYTRVSERLRHKGRAVNAWDYEHLVLDRFPVIYKVKCVPNVDPNCLCREVEQTILSKEKCCGPQIAPGHVMIVPVSNLRNRNALNPLKPKTSRRVLREIEAYLKRKASPFVRIHARNPIYEQIIVAFKVKFYDGVDKGYYLRKLNDDIVHFLTPWAFDAEADVKFGEVVYASSIIDFIEERSYVNFITDFMMGVCLEPCCDDERGLTISGKVTNTDGEPLEGVIYAKGPAGGTKIQKGEFLLILPTSFEAILVIECPGYKSKEIKVTKSKSLHLVLHKDDQFIDEPRSKWADIDDCSELEELLQEEGSEKNGLIVVRPSTPRSILASAPRHIIIPYSEPPHQDPCEKRKLAPAVVPAKVNGTGERGVIEKEVKPSEKKAVVKEAEKVVAKEKAATKPTKKTAAKTAADKKKPK